MLKRVRSVVSLEDEPLAVRAELPEPRSADTPALPLSRRGRQPLNGRWSGNHDVCVECKRDVVPHAARGLCRTCYARARSQVA